MSVHLVCQHIKKVAALHALIGMFVIVIATPAQSQPFKTTVIQDRTNQDVAICAGCHGVKGEGNSLTGFPRLAGLSALYLQQQLANFSSGERQSPIMQPVSKALTSVQQRVLITYFSHLPSPLPIETTDTTHLTSANVGAWLALRGRWDSDLPACVQCHAQGGIGVGTAFPPLAGQPVTYIENQLKAFKSKTRPGGPMNLMGVVASKLSDADIAAVAHYYGDMKLTPASASIKRVTQ